MLESPTEIARVVLLTWANCLYRHGQVALVAALHSNQ